MDIPKQPFWSLSATNAVSALETNVSGLSETEAKNRLRHYGTNVFHGKERSHTVSLFFRQFVNPLIFLLIFAAALTAFLGEHLDTLVIIFAVLLNVLLGFFQEHHAEDTLAKLTTYIKDRALVMREGREQEMDSSILGYSKAVHTI